MNFELSSFPIRSCQSKLRIRLWQG